MFLKSPLKRFMKRLSTPSVTVKIGEYGSVNIAIIKDRVEIRSPGLLYGGLTVADIRKKMVSAKRNELLAELTLQRSHRNERGLFYP